MIINGYDYRFAYTVGAHLEISSLKYDPPKNNSDQMKIIIQIAPLLSKGYEDSQIVANPAYVPRYLTKDEILSLPVGEIEQLMREVNDAMAAGRKRTVEAEPVKKEEGEGSR